MTRADDETSPRWHVTAAVAAWLLPGLGHYLLGHRTRGIILAVAIGLLWLAGLFIGGIGVFDRSQMQNNIVQIGQIFVAPSLVAAYYQNEWEPAAGFDLVGPDDNPPYEPSFARTNEQGVLYTALAGMLNLLAAIDVLYRDPRDPRSRHPDHAESAA